MSSTLQTLPHFQAPQSISLWRNPLKSLALVDIALWQSTLLSVFSFAVIRLMFFKVTKLKEAAYFSESMLLELVRTGSGALLSLAIAAFVMYGWSRLRWADFGPGVALRCFIGVIGGTLAWTFSVYDYNLYYGQLHLTERILLLALYAAGMWRPVMFVPFLALVYLITHQFDQPLACTWTDKRILFDLMSLFVGWMAVKLWKPKNWPVVSSTDYFFIVICMVAANYFIPGFGKLVSGWQFVERLDNLFIGSYLNGWYGFLSQEQALAWARLIAWWNPAMVWGSLILELAALVCLVNRATCIGILLGCVGLHSMICVSTGILFWKWIILDLALSSVLIWGNRTLISDLFTRQRFLVSMLLIAVSYYVFSPPWLAWYDTELNEQYHLEAVTESGETFSIPRTFMVPYEVYFAQNKFHFLTHDKYVNGRYGTTPSWDVCLGLDGRPTCEQAEAVREEFGVVEYSEQKASAFDRFISRYFANLNARGSQHSIVPDALHPPQHIYSVVPAPRYALQSPVTKVRVIHERSLYQRDRIETLKREVVREITIPMAGSAT